MITVQHNLNELNRALAMYQRASGKTVDEVLKKQAPKLGFALSKEFDALKPGKGQVRAERLAALKAGEGVHVRPRVWDWVYRKYRAATSIIDQSLGMIRGKRQELAGTLRRKGKRLNLQALAIQREINVRESGRGFLRQSAKFVGSIDKDAKARSRYNKTLAEMGFKAAQHSVTFVWGGFSELSSSAAKAIGRTRGMAAMARAISAVTEDIVPYLNLKLGEAAVQAGFKAK